MAPETETPRIRIAEIAALQLAEQRKMEKPTEPQRRRVLIHSAVQQQEKQQQQRHQLRGHVCSSVAAFRAPPLPSSHTLPPLT